MTHSLFVWLFEANLAAAVAVLTVLALRRPARKLAGARIAYALWLIVPAAMLATLAPARTVTLSAPARIASKTLAAMPVFAASDIPIATAAPPRAGAMPDLSPMLLDTWLAGVAVSLAMLVIGQRRAVRRFGTITVDAQDPRRLRASNASIGPAIVGVLWPRLIVPADFESRFDVSERALILAHERMHLDGGHPLVNALTALAQAVNWFNPLIHLAARYARTDQELACDAAVVSRFPGERHAYAKALLKTQLIDAPLPLGCAWPPSSSSRLLERIEMLALKTPGRLRLFAGATVVTTLTLGAGLAAWAASPPVAQFAKPAQAAATIGFFRSKTVSLPLAGTEPARLQASSGIASSDTAQTAEAAFQTPPATASASVDVVAQPAVEHMAPRQVVVAMMSESGLASSQTPLAVTPKEMQGPVLAPQPQNADGQKLLVYVDWPIRQRRIFLGCLSCTASDPTSIWNPSSPYGWANPKGIWSRFGFRDSVCDIHFTYPAPRVFDEEWTFYYRLSADSISRASICSPIMSRQGCTAIRAVCEGRPAPAVAPSDWSDVSLDHF